MSRMIIDNVDRYRIVEPLFEGVRVVLSQRGEGFSPAYLAGISGAAFRTGGICPCAPTCSYAMETTELISLLGYEFETLPFPNNNTYQGQQLAAIVERVKAEVEGNRPVLVWNAFTFAEWDVVCGFDEADDLFFGRGSYVGGGEYAKASRSRITKAPAADKHGAIVIGAKNGQFRAEEAELAALQQAVTHAYSTKNHEKADSDEWTFLEGLLCYDRWVNDFRNPEKTLSPGDSYCWSVYRSTHRAAAAFLSEIAANYPLAMGHLTKAARHFTEEADALDRGVGLLDWQAPRNPHPEQIGAIAFLLGAARNHFARGIAEIEIALEGMNLAS